MTDVFDQHCDLLLPDAVGEEHANAALLALVLAVGRERDVTAVEQPLGHSALGPARRGKRRQPPLACVRARVATPGHVPR
jgi:hypothetical protein